MRWKHLDPVDFIVWAVTLLVVTFCVVLAWKVFEWGALAS